MTGIRFRGAGAFMTVLGIALTLGSAMSCTVTGRRSSTVAAARHWSSAQEYMDRGMVRHARREARVVLKLEPGHEGARSLLGGAGADDRLAAEEFDLDMILMGARRAYGESRLADARRLADEALLADPGNSSARDILARIEEERYRPSPLGVNDVLEGLFEEGMARYRKGEWSAAAETFQKAHVTSPSHEQIWKYFNLSRTKAEESNAVKAMKRARESAAAGKRDEAVRLLRKVLEVDPDHREALKLMESLGVDPRDAERLARAKRHFNLGVEAYEEGRWADAAREWEVVVSLVPDDEEAGRLLRRARGKLSAEKRAAKKRVPGMHRRARTLYQKGKLEPAARIYRDILEIDPADEKARMSLDLIEDKLAEP